MTLPAYYILVFLSVNGYYGQTIGEFPTQKACERAAKQIVHEDTGHKVYGKHICLQRRPL